MKPYLELAHETNTLLQMRGLIEVYEELAAMRLSAIRKEIIENRDFFDRLQQLALEIGTDAQDPTVPIKQIALLVTANEGLYGDIIERTFQKFLAFITQNETDVVVTGEIGVHLMHDYAPTKQFSHFPLSDTHVDEASFTKIVMALTPYDTVHVFYGKFNSIATQNITMSTLTGYTESNALQAVQKKKHMFYLYEPSLPSVSSLFRTEIKASVFDQILQESQLAKHASRMMHLDSAIERMDEQLMKLAEQKRQSVKKIAERKQHARMAGLFARGGGL